MATDLSVVRVILFYWLVIVSANMGDIDQTSLGLSSLCSLHQLDSLCKSYLSFVQSDLRIHSQKLFFKIANNFIYSRK